MHAASAVQNRSLDRFRFVPLRSSDGPSLAVWVARTHVARWFREPSELASVEQNYGPLADGFDPTEGSEARSKVPPYATGATMRPQHFWGTPSVPRSQVERGVEAQIPLESYELLRALASAS